MVIISKIIPRFKDKRVFLLSFIISEIIVFIIGYFMGSPFMFYLSGIAFVLSFIAVFYNNVILNTLVIALTPLFIGMLGNVFVVANLDTIIHAVIALNIVLVGIFRWKKNYPVLIPVCAILYLLIIASVKFYFDDSFIGIHYYTSFSTGGIAYVITFDIAIAVFIIVNNPLAFAKLKQIGWAIRVFVLEGFESESKIGKSKIGGQESDKPKAPVFQLKKKKFVES